MTPSRFLNPSCIRLKISTMKNNAGRICRQGLTLIEIMIALTMTLIVLGAMMTAFQFASAEMQNGRAALEMANRLRLAEELLRSDLRKLMVDPRPYTDSTNPNGYFEVLEGPRRDSAVPLSFVDSDGDLIPDLVDVDNTGDPSWPVGMRSGNDVEPAGVGNGVDDALDPNRIGSNYLSDYDDGWSGVVRSEKRPFRGRIIYPTSGAFWDGNNVYPRLVFPAAPDLPAVSPIESPMAEVVWFTVFNDTDGNQQVEFQNGEIITLYRRALLILPSGTPLPSFATLAAARQYLATCDVSARIEQVFDDVNFTPGRTMFRIIANTPKELANREFRWGRNNPGMTYPYPFNRTLAFALRSADYVRDGAGAVGIAYNGNDIVLTDLVGFNVQVYSPTASVLIANNNTVVEPGDTGYQQFVNAGETFTPVGAFVDLGHPGGGWFSGPPEARSQLATQFLFEAGLTNGLVDLTYDTWTPRYEVDGVDQDGTRAASMVANVPGQMVFYRDTNTLVDQGTNGADNQDAPLANPAGPDDQNELETAPPYPYPVRGVKISIGLIERGTKQVHQSSIIHSYVPE